jgi:hypothetical protein
MHVAPFGQYGSAAVQGCFPLKQRSGGFDGHNIGCQMIVVEAGTFHALMHSMSIHGFRGEQFQRIELLALVCERVVASYCFGALCQLSERSRSKAASWKAAAPDEMSEVLAMNGAMPRRGRARWAEGHTKHTCLSTYSLELESVSLCSRLDFYACIPQVAQFMIVREDRRPSDCKQQAASRDPQTSRGP